MGAQLIKIEIIDFSKTMVIGKKIREKVDIVSGDFSFENLWKTMNDEGSLNYLQSMHGCITKKDTIGWMGDFKPGDNEFTYLAGVLASPQTAVPNGFEYRVIESTKMAVAWIKETDDSEGGNIHSNASDLLRNALVKYGYEYDPSNGFYEMEFYSYERFLKPAAEGKPVSLDFYSPCKRK